MWHGAGACASRLFLPRGAGGQHVYLSASQFWCAFADLRETDDARAGHQPHGDCPCVIRTGPVTVITADTSYSEMGHKSEWGTDNRGVNAISEVLLYADGTSEVHGFLADGSPIAYQLGVAGDDYVGHQLGNGYWVKAKVVGPDPISHQQPEYVLAMMQGFKYLTERKQASEMDALSARFNLGRHNLQQCHGKGLAQAAIQQGGVQKLTERLRLAKELYEQGLIDETIYQEKQREILASI